MLNAGRTKWMQPQWPGAPDFETLPRNQSGELVGMELPISPSSLKLSPRPIFSTDHDVGHLQVPSASDEQQSYDADVAF